MVITKEDELLLDLYHALTTEAKMILLVKMQQSISCSDTETLQEKNNLIIFKKRS